MRRHAAREGLVAPLLRIYGVRPWELDLFTGDELDQLLTGGREETDDG